MAQACVVACKISRDTALASIVPEVLAPQQHDLLELGDGPISEGIRPRFDTELQSARGQTAESRHVRVGPSPSQTGFDHWFPVRQPTGLPNPNAGVCPPYVSISW